MSKKLAIFLSHVPAFTIEVWYLASRAFGMRCVRMCKRALALFRLCFWALFFVDCSRGLEQLARRGGPEKVETLCESWLIG